MKITADKSCTRPLIGAHFSIAGGLEQALIRANALDCRVAQIFTKNARTWAEKMPDQDQITLFKKIRKESNISHLISHCTYLINIASPDTLKMEKSRTALAAELDRSKRLGVDFLVLHPGAHLGEGIQKGIKRAAMTLNFIFNRPDPSLPILLIETTAGSGTTLGGRFEEIQDIFGLLDHPESFGVCLDTSHIFASGYDFRTPSAYGKTLEAFDRCIGLDHLNLLHLNDSKPGLGSQKDRHEHIGMGSIGSTGFRLIMKDPAMESIPKIIETPKTLNGKEMDPINLQCLRNFSRELAD